MRDIADLDAQRLAEALANMVALDAQESDGKAMMDMADGVPGKQLLSFLRGQQVGFSVVHGLEEEVALNSVLILAFRLGASYGRLTPDRLVVARPN
jgi:hypothetical protein